MRDEMLDVCENHSTLGYMSQDDIPTDIGIPYSPTPYYYGGGGYGYGYTQPYYQPTYQQPTYFQPTFSPYGQAIISQACPDGSWPTHDASGNIVCPNGMQSPVSPSAGMPYVCATGIPAVWNPLYNNYVCPSAPVGSQAGCPAGYSAYGNGCVTPCGAGQVVNPVPIGYVPGTSMPLYSCGSPASTVVPTGCPAGTTQQYNPSTGSWYCSPYSAITGGLPSPSYQQPTYQPQTGGTPGISAAEAQIENTIIAAINAGQIGVASCGRIIRNKSQYRSCRFSVQGLAKKYNFTQVYHMLTRGGVMPQRVNPGSFVNPAIGGGMIPSVEALAGLLGLSQPLVDYCVPPLYRTWDDSQGKYSCLPLAFSVPPGVKPTQVSVPQLPSGGGGGGYVPSGMIYAEGPHTGGGAVMCDRRTERKVCDPINRQMCHCEPKPQRAHHVRMSGMGLPLPLRHAIRHTRRVPRMALPGWWPGHHVAGA